MECIKGQSLGFAVGGDQLGDLVASCSGLLVVLPCLSDLVLFVPFTCMMHSAFSCALGGPGLMFSSKMCNNFIIHISAQPVL